MKGEVDKLRDRVYMGYFKRCWRINDYDWAFLLNFDKGKENELYDMKADPEMMNNIIEENPGKANELELDLRRFVADLK